MFRNLYWWFVHRFVLRHRYNILVTSLRPGYYDPEIRLRSAIFDEVERFWSATGEPGKDKVLIDWTHNEEHQRAAKVLQEAVGFWRANKQTLQYEENPDLQVEARNHLHQIIDVMDYLWYP